MGWWGLAGHSRCHFGEVMRKEEVNEGVDRWETDQDLERKSVTCF